MSSSKCELVNGLTALFSLVALTSMFAPIVTSTELLALRLLAFVITVAHVHYAVCVVQQMCDHLKINALSLKKRETESFKEHLLRDSIGDIDSQLGMQASQDSSLDCVSQLSDEQSLS